MVGLGNVDDTSDASKPISTATQQALSTLDTAVQTKANADNPVLTGTTTTSHLYVTGDVSIQNNGYSKLSFDDYHAIILRGDISYSAPSYTPYWDDFMTFVEYSGIFRFREVNGTTQNLILEISPTNMTYKGQSLAYKPWVVARTTARTGTGVTAVVTLTNQQGAKVATCYKQALVTYRFQFPTHPLGTDYCTFANIVGGTAGFTTVNNVAAGTVDVITFNQAGTAVDTLSFYVKVML